jgi:non-ribosomal peptide synthetase component E (peptide arylation enzyme)
MEPDMNWFGVLAHYATRTPEQPITMFDGETTTYATMARRATELAGGLADRGIGAGGDPVLQLSRVSGDRLCRQLPRGP